MPVLPLSHGFGGDADAMLMTTDPGLLQALLWAFQLPGFGPELQL